MPIPNWTAEGVLPPVNLADFRVDGYTVALEQASELLVEATAYWYGLWSHRRTMTWKGFVQVDLRPDRKSEARLLLTSREDEGDE